MQLGLAGFLLSTRAHNMKRPTENMEVTPMRLGKKKVPIGIALGTLVLALLTVTAIGSASKCSANCAGSEITDQWLATKTGFKDSVKNAYAASTVSQVKSNSSEERPTVKAVAEKADFSAFKAKKTFGNREADNFKKALIAILLVAATESIHQAASN